jgi:rubrerythrin
MLQELPAMDAARGPVSAQVELSLEYRREIESSIQDELADTGFYACIANEAPNSILRLLSQSILGEEFGHARTQAALLSTNPPPLAPPEPVECSGNFIQDVTKARNGEIAAITRYAHLAAEAPTPELRYLFTSILTDEYAHSRAWTAMIQAASDFQQS